jgi:membrane dipeptidase
MKSLALATVALFALAAVPASARTPEQVAEAALKAAPVFDGHNDVPIQLRGRFGNVIGDFDFVDTTDTGAEHSEGRTMHTDLTRLRKGKVGAQFWSVYVSAGLSEPEAVQATLEQIDVTRRLVARYPDDLQFALTARDVEASIKAGRIASLLGIEGGHSIGGSLGVLRQMYDLGVRYMTLTHSKTLSWVDSATDVPRHGGLTDHGRNVIREMNRIGMLVDLSHVSEDTMHDVLDVARAPVIFSHSGARAINGHARNVPDSVLARLPQNGGVVMVVGLPGFLSEPARQWFGNRQAESVAQQFVDAGLGTGLGVDRLDDHGAVEARPRGAIGQGLAGHRAGHDHRIGRHFAHVDLARGAVDDLGRRAEVDAHRQHRAFAHAHAFGHFGARADEAHCRR